MNTPVSLGTKPQWSKVIVAGIVALSSGYLAGVWLEPVWDGNLIAIVPALIAACALSYVVLMLVVAWREGSRAASLVLAIAALGFACIAIMAVWHSGKGTVRAAAWGGGAGTGLYLLSLLRKRRFVKWITKELGTGRVISETEWQATDTVRTFAGPATGFALVLVPFGALLGVTFYGLDAMGIGYRSRELFVMDGSAAVNAVAFSPDGGTLISGGEDRAFRLWNTASGKLSATCAGTDSAITGVAYLPGKDTPVSIRSEPNSAHGEAPRYLVKLHDPETGQVNGEEEVPRWDYRLLLQIARSGLQKPAPLTPLDAALTDGIPGGIIGGVLPAQPPAQSPAAFASRGEGRSGGRRSTEMEELRGAIYAVVVHSAEPSVAVSPDGRTLATASAGSSIEVLDLMNGGLRTLSTEIASPLEQKEPADSSGRTRLVPPRPVSNPGHGRVVIWPNNNAIALVTPKDDRVEMALWDVPSGKQQWSRTFQASRSDSRYRPRPNLIAMSQDAGTVAIAVHAVSTSWRYYTRLFAEQHWIDIVDVRSGRTRLSLPGQRDEITSIAFSPNGKLLATSDGGGAIRMWSLH